MTRLGLIVWMFGLLLAYPAHSDVLRPGYLEIRQTGSDTYSLLFKIPARGEELRLGIYLGLPEGAIDEAAPRAAFSNGAYVERRTIRRAGGLAGQAVAIQGLSATSTDVLARVETLGGAVQTERLNTNPDLVCRSGHAWRRRCRGHLSAAGRRAHSVRIRSSVVRPGARRPGSGLAPRRADG